MTERLKKPDWLKVRINVSDDFLSIKKIVSEKKLNTVCEEAACPNIHECWGKHKTATFMILGDLCTRRCRFCSVKTGLPLTVDWDEPRRVAESVKELSLNHVVITMVNRDDLPDGGSKLMAKTIEAIKVMMPACQVEILASDMMGKKESIQTMLDAKPDIMSHNLETVQRLTQSIRSRSDYQRSLDFLKISRQINPEIVTKSSLMLGLGESLLEIEETMNDLLKVGVSLLNLGQYLQPTKTNIPVQRYVTPDEFASLKHTAEQKGFIHVVSGPLVRSSYHAGDQYNAYKKNVIYDPNKP